MTVPICILGAGSIGQRHIGCALAADGIALTAVVEPDSVARVQAAAQGLPVVATLDEVPQHTRGAVVATPTPDHVVSALACLDKGWAVLVEKPLAATVAEADLLCDRAAALGLPVFTGHHRRCHPFVAQARRRMPSLGNMVAVEGLWALRKHDCYFDMPWRRAAGAGPILTNLSHEIDLLQCLAGPITEVAAVTANAARELDIEDTTALSLRFASGALGSFALSDAGSSPWGFEAATGENPAIAVRGPDPLRFIGTRGSLSFPSLDMWLGVDWQHEMTQTKGPDLPRLDAVAAQLVRFAAVVAGGADDFLATAADGASTVKVLAAVQQAALSGQTQTIIQKGQST